VMDRALLHDSPPHLAHGREVMTRARRQSPSDVLIQPR
jgi:hypothetical protein